MNKIKLVVMIMVFGVLLSGPTMVKAEKVLKVGVIRDPVNQRYATPGVEPYITGVYEQLVFVTPDMQLVPGLATKWERIDDLTWRFYLRKGVTYHNGKPFNSGTVKFSIEWFLEKILWSARLRIDKVKIINEYTVDIITKEPLAVLPGFMSHGWTIMSEPESQKAGKPIGTGPFMFDSSVPGQQLVVVKNPKYWMEGLPKVDRIIFKVMPDDSSRVMALMGGEVDVALQIPYPNVETIKQSGFKTFQTVTSTWAGLTFSQWKEPFDDVRTRKAVGHAINRKPIIENVLYGLAVDSNSPVPPNTPWSGEDKLEGLPYDPKLAGMLLDQAGWKMGSDGIREKDGQKMKITLRMIDYASVLIHGREMAQVIVEQLAKVGIKTSISVEEQDMFYDESAAKKKGHLYLDYHGTFSGELSATLWDTYQPNRDTFLEGSALYGPFIPPVVGEWLFKLQNATSNDAKEEYLVNISRLINRDMVLTLPFLNYYNVVGAAKNVKGYTPHPLFFWPDVWNKVDLK